MTLITTREEFYTPLFLKYDDFGPLNTSRAVCQKTPPFYVFFWSRMCTISYLTGRPLLLWLQYMATPLTNKQRKQQAMNTHKIANYIYNQQVRALKENLFSPFVSLDNRNTWYKFVMTYCINAMFTLEINPVYVAHMETNPCLWSFHNGLDAKLIICCIWCLDYVFGDKLHVAVLPKYTNFNTPVWRIKKQNNKKVWIKPYWLHLHYFYFFIFLGLNQ